MVGVRRVAREPCEIRLPDGTMTTLLRVHDPRARRLRLSVDAGGARLTIPPGVGERAAETFLDRHADWLLMQLRRYRQTEALRMPVRPGHPGPIRLRGADLALHWQTGRFARVQEVPAGLIFELPERCDPAVSSRLLREFYLAQARADVGRWLPRWLPTLPVAPREVRIRPLRSLWGSLSPSRTVSLDLALILAPSAAFEYVLIHELCHLIQANHSPAFWREVESRCPEWRHWRAWFRERGGAIKAELATLLDPGQ